MQFGDVKLKLAGATAEGLTCGCEPPPAHSAGPERLGAPPDFADSSGLLSPTSPGEKPGWTARWFDLATAGWTCTSSHRLPPCSHKVDRECNSFISQFNT